MKVNSPSDIRMAYKKMKQLFPDSDHIMLGYVLKQDQIGWQDDYEHGSGQKVSQILTAQGKTGTTVFVTRKYSGVHLGKRRFMYIDNVAREASKKLSEIE